MEDLIKLMKVGTVTVCTEDNPLYTITYGHVSAEVLNERSKSEWEGLECTEQEIFRTKAIVNGDTINWSKEIQESEKAFNVTIIGW